MLLAAAFAMGFKGLSAVSGLFLVGGGYLGFKYGSAVEKKAAAALAKAGSVASSTSGKV